MPRHIKSGALAGSQDEADAKIRGTVEAIIADVRARGDAAVRELSERFDKWSPPSFRLSEAEIATLVAKVSPQTIDDIEFAQAQIRNFAQVQRASLQGCRGRDPARRVPRPSAHPGRPGRLLCAGRALPDGRLGAYVDRHRQGRRGRAHRRLHPAQPGRPASRDDRRDASGRRRRDPCAGRGPGGGGDGARHRDVRGRSTCWSAPATPMSPKPSASSTAGSASTSSPARPRSWSSPTTAPTPRCARPTSWARPSTGRPRRRSC